jgi:hypothetical protein
MRQKDAIAESVAPGNRFSGTISVRQFADNGHGQKPASRRTFWWYTVTRKGRPADDVESREQMDRQRKVVKKMNVFDFAMKMEEESREHYEKLAAAAGSENARRIFTLLADSEREHYQHLEHLKAGRGSRDTESSVLERSGGQIRELVDNLDPDVVLPNDSDGYRHAVKAEEGSIDLYEKMADRETNTAAADLLRKLAEEEQLHLQVIENIYDFVESPRTYLAWGEFSNLQEY